jgi:hypothetical protein
MHMESQEGCQEALLFWVMFVCLGKVQDLIAKGEGLSVPVDLTKRSLGLIKGVRVSVSLQPHTVLEIAG